MGPDSGDETSTTRRQRVRFSTGSIALVVAAFLAAGAVVALVDAARRPLLWVLATAIVAWLVSWIIDLLSRWIPRLAAILLTVLAIAVLVGGGWFGVTGEIRSGVDTLVEELPAAAQDIEDRSELAADFRLSERTEAFINNIAGQIPIDTGVVETAGTASSYVVMGILMLFLVAYGPQFVAGALRQIADPDRRAQVASVVYHSGGQARGYLLAVIAQTIVVTGVCGLVFQLLDLPAPLTLGLLVGALGAIPYFGMVLGGFAPLLVSATAPSPGIAALVVAGVVLALQLIEAYVVRPRVDPQSVHVGPALVVIGLLVGFELYGIGGAVFGTALIVMGWAVLQALPARGVQPTP